MSIFCLSYIEASIEAPRSLHEGRLITNNVSLVEKLIQDSHQKATSPRACVILDLSKAFDFINWNVL